MYLSLLLFFIFLSGCSTTLKDFFEGEETTEERSEKLINEDFKEEKAVFEKFKVTKISKIKEIEKEQESRESPPQAKHQRTDIRPPNLKRVLSPRNALKTKVQVKKTANEKMKIERQPYPVDYPEEIKALDGHSTLYWDKLVPYIFPGEKMILNITYLGVNTGKIILSSKEDTRLGNSDAYHVNVRVKTADFYSYLYEVDDYCDSYIQKKNFRPLKFSLIQRQSSQDIDDVQLFDHDKFKVFSFYKRVTKKKTKKQKKIEWIPYFFQDPLSIFYFIRGLPMDSKVKYAIPIINSGKIEMLYAQYEKEETISTKIGKKKAYRLNIDTQVKGKTLNGGAMVFWFSADEKRVFLKFEAKIKIGSISGAIESYEEK